MLDWGVNRKCSIVTLQVHLITSHHISLQLQLALLEIAHDAKKVETPVGPSSTRPSRPFLPLVAAPNRNWRPPHLLASTLTSITTTVPAALCPTAHSTGLKGSLPARASSVSLAVTGPCHYLTLPETKHHPRREKHPDKLTRRVSIFSRLVGIDRPARPGQEEWRTRDVLRHGRQRLVSPESIDPVES